MNFYSVFNVLFPKCVTHKKKSCVYFSNFPLISLRELDKIYLNFLFNFSKPSSGCKQ